MRPAKSTAPLPLRVAVAILVSLVLSGPSTAHAAATITVVNLDGAGEGFNDPAPLAPVGGNSGTTLGQQRLIAMQYAADIWGAALDSTVEVRAAVAFNPLQCNSGGAVIGSTGPNSLSRDFAGAPQDGMWFVAAVANKLAGVDLDPTDDDLSGAFNSSIGTTCPLPRVFYYGLDGNPPGNDIDFVSVALHELAHGLGFVSLVDLNSGGKFAGRDDSFSVALEDHRACKLFLSMSNPERFSAITATGDLHWVGGEVVGAGGVLTDGVHATGHVEMYAPPQVNGGSSVSHFSNELVPDQLMEPSYVGANHDLGLALPLMRDIGWAGNTAVLLGGDCPNGSKVVNSTTIGEQKYPSAASDALGNSVVVWQSDGINNFFLPGLPGQDGSFAGIYGQRLDSNGARVGGEFQVHTYTTFQQMLPEVAVAPDGRFVVVWTSASDQDGSDAGVFGQRFDSAGQRAGTEFQVNTTTSGSQGFAPQVGMDDAGNFVVVWNDSEAQDGSYSGVWGQRFDSDATPLGTEFQVNTYTPDRQGENGLALSVAGNGDFIAVWKSSTQDSGEVGHAVDGGVYAQRFLADGSRLGTEFRVNTYTPGDQGTFGIDIDTDAAGNFVIVWAGNNDGDRFEGIVPLGGIIGQRFSSSGAAVGPEFVVNNVIRGFQDSPMVSMDALGNFVVSWETLPDFPHEEPCGPNGGPLCSILADSNVAARRFDSSGTPLAPEFVVNSYTPQMQRYPVVATDPDGDFLVVWTSNTCENETENFCFNSEDGMADAIIAQHFGVAPVSCDPTPRTSCLAPGKSGLQVAPGKLKWLWKKGPQLTSGHFGNPIGGGTNYAFCVYQDGAASNPIMEAEVPTTNSWKTIGSKGFQFKGDAQGISTVKMKAGASGKSLILIKGKGPNLMPPSLPLGSGAVTVQLVSSTGDCFEAVYDPPAQRNQATAFKDKF